MSSCLTCAGSFTRIRSNQRYCSAYCRDNAPTKRAYTRRYQAIRREAINNIKLEQGCSRCGYKACAAALDFHHVSGVKLFNISQDPKRSWTKTTTEIAKCVVLCRNCHSVETQLLRHFHTKRKDGGRGAANLRLGNERTA